MNCEYCKIFFDNVETLQKHKFNNKVKYCFISKNKKRQKIRVLCKTHAKLLFKQYELFIAKILLSLNN